MDARPILIIGAAGGVGSAVTEALLREGRFVVGTSRQQARLDQLDEIKRNNPSGRLERRISDFTDEDSVSALFKEIRDSFGPIAGIVNCAGNVLLKPAHLTSMQEFEQTVATNLRTAFLALRHGINAFGDDGGSIVFFSTAAVRAGVPNHDVIDAAKSAVEGLARGAASTYAQKLIRINSVSLGLVKTPLTVRIHSSASASQSSLALHALGSLGEPSDVASLVVWLLSDHARWMTGQNISLDGGLSLKTKAAEVRT